MLKYWVNLQRVFALVLISLYISWMMFGNLVFSFVRVPTKLVHVGDDHRLSLSQQIPCVNRSFFLCTSSVIFSVQTLLFRNPNWIFPNSTIYPIIL